MIDIKNVSFQYHKNAPFVLRNLNFHLDEGSVLSVLGKNGIGKTTFLKCLTSDLTGYLGQITICGKEVRSLSTHELSQYIAIVASNNPCYQNLVVGDYLVTGLANRLTHLQSPNRQQYKRAADVLEQMGQIALLNRGVFELSSGEMQIVKIARAILQNPRVIVFDEPTSNLDIKNQLLVLDQITALSKQGYTVITTTHNPGQSIELGGMVLMLSETQQIFGQTKEVLNADNLRMIYGLIVTVEDIAGRQFTIFEDRGNAHRLVF